MNLPYCSVKFKGDFAGVFDDAAIARIDTIGASPHMRLTIFEWDPAQKRWLPVDAMTEVTMEQLSDRVVYSGISRTGTTQMGLTVDNAQMRIEATPQKRCKDCDV